MSTLNLIFDLARADKLSRQILLRGSSANKADDVIVRRHRLLQNHITEAESTSQIFIKADGSLSVEIALPVMLPGIVPISGSSTLTAGAELQVNHVTTAPFEFTGLFALPIGCKVKITNIKGSPSADGGVNLVIIHD
jgi:hypothetical protein